MGNATISAKHVHETKCRHRYTNKINHFSDVTFYYIVNALWCACVYQMASKKDVDSVKPITSSAS